MVDSIVTGQKVSENLLAAAKRMRASPTRAEQRLWEQLRAGRLEGLHFRRQQVIGQFVVEFYNHAAGVVIEVDGSVHNDTDQGEYDRFRQRFLEESGLKLIRFGNEEIEEGLGEVLETIRLECLYKV